MSLNLISKIVYDKLKQNRESLSESSLKTYTSILMNLHKRVFGDPVKLPNFNKVAIIQEDLKDIPVNKRKTILSALYVLTGKEAYKGEMMNDIKDYNKEINTQEKSQTQKENWATGDEIDEVMKTTKHKAMVGYKMLKSGENMKALQDIQDYIILCLLGGKYINPRRSKDYVDFKIKEIGEHDNYLKGKKLYFKSYKGSKSKGVQVIDIPNELKRILTRWIKANPTDFLLFDGKKGRLSNVKLNQRLNKIFGRKIAINALRHTFLTEKHGETMDKYNELMDDLKDMGSSILQAKTYIKKD